MSDQRPASMRAVASPVSSFSCCSTPPGGFGSFSSFASFSAAFRDS